MIVKSPSNDPELVAFSTIVYRLLLKFYPARFRQDYAVHMAQVFRDSCMQTLHRDGFFGMLMLWGRTLIDWFKTVIEEQLNRDVVMERSKFIQLSGWSMVIAAISLLLTLLPEADEILHNLYLSFGAPIDLAQHIRTKSIAEFVRNLPIPIAVLLITVGMAGLDLRYGKQAGRSARLALKIGMLGGVAGLFFHILMLTGVDYGRMILNMALFVLFGGLFIFGLFILRTRPMQRGNSLPLLTGIWWPMLVILSYGFPQVVANWSEIIRYLAALTVLVAIAVFLALLGFALQADVLSEEKSNSNY